MPEFDDVVIGGGMGGLTVAALMARSGRRVLVLEAHDVPGGYAHSFEVRGFRFCAQVHYVFGCGEGETIHALLDTLGIAEEVPFVRLDPEGFDHVCIGSDRVRIPNGLGKYRDRLTRQFPEAREPIHRYFATIASIGDELATLDAIPTSFSIELLRAAVQHRHLIRFIRWTLEDLYDHVRMPPKLRAILAGQSGDYLLPPRDVSLLLHAALVCSYDRGAYYPRHHYHHFVDVIAETIRARPGCQILLSHEVERIHTSGGRVVGVSTSNGERFTARRYISNVDPQKTAEITEGWRQAPSTQRYEYSSGTITLYLGIRGLDLRDHGFGSFNVWHYPHADLNRVYDDQLLRHDLSDPWLFLSTPSLHSDAPGLCPPGDQVLEVATSADYDHWADLRRTDRRAYNREKKRVRDTILDVIASRYAPKLRDHLSMVLMGTPATNERFCRAPSGNSYGAKLTPKNVGLGRRPHITSFDNLWMVNATAGFPSVAGTIGAGMRLFRELDG